MREFFLKTKRIGFSKWTQDDLDLAKCLWGNPDTTKYISASGCFTLDEIEKRLQTEITNQNIYGFQYWPIFELETNELIGCAGLRPYKEQYEIGFHLLPKYWHQGYAYEAANTVIDYAFFNLNADYIVAGHNPNNIASRNVILKLGFKCIGEEFYPPTNLFHPLYKLEHKKS